MHDQLKRLQAIFANTAFVIPDYQRGYAWERQHRADLLSDLGDLDALTSATGAAEKVHYTGTLVLHRGRHAPKQALTRTFEVLDVVDGQQRLTTLVILLSVIARAFDKLDTDDARGAAKELRETYVSFRGVHKLVPNGEAAVFFRDHVLAESPTAVPNSAPERALLAARVQFTEFVEANLKPLSTVEAKLEWLARWTTVITTRLGFVVFEVRDEADVGVMFEAMNARGKKLTQFELVKNYLLFASAKVMSGDALAAMTADINHTWSDVVRTLDGADLTDEDDTLLHYHWWIWPHATALDGDSLSKTSDIHRAIKATIRVASGADAVHERISDYLADLRRAARAFADLRNPDHDRAFAFAGAQRGALVDRARGITRIGRTAVTTPLLMASWMKFGGEPTELAEILRLVETFAFRLALFETRSHTGESRLMKLAFESRASNVDASTVQQRLREIVAYYAPDKTMEKVLLEADSSVDDGNFYAWAQLPYFLFEYERNLAERAKQKFAYSWKAFYARWRESIEHILPQGDSTLKDPYWAQRFDVEKLKKNRHRLGNLTLTEWNSHYSNFGFDRKCGAPGCGSDAKVYRNSRFLCERELADVSEWTEKAIDDRQKRLAAFAMQRWAI